MGQGGGSASGRTDFPNYMKIYHSNMLNGGMGDSIYVPPVLFDISVAEAFNSAAAGNSPYFEYISSQLDPDSMFFTASGGVINGQYSKPFDLLKLMHDFDYDADLTDRKTALENSTWVQDVMAAQSASLDDEITIMATPKLHARMRDIGAVMSSAFVIGDTLLEDSKIKALAGTRLQLEQLALQREEVAIKSTTALLDFRRMTAAMSMDFMKIYHTVRAEVQDTNAEWIAKDKLWDLKLFQYTSNPLGAISGSALSVDTGKGSKTATAVGGMVSGAAAGAMMGSTINPGYGTAIGGVIGGIVGLAGGLIK